MHDTTITKTKIIILENKYILYLDTKSYLVFTILMYFLSWRT